MIDFNNKDEVALIHKHLSTEIYANYGISLGWIETIRKYIEYLEVENKKLTEENERLRFISAHICVGDVITSEQIEKQRMAHTLPGMHGDPVGPVGMVWVESYDEVRAETVRKMQERLKNYLREVADGEIGYGWIDQIAKEMLEENNV